MAGSGLLGENFLGGAESEYCARVLLSGLGLCTPVPREGDIGFDFHCLLAHRVGPLLGYSSPFLVSVKSRSKPNIVVDPPATIIKKNGYDHLEWFFAQQIPMFLGVVEKDAFSISLYSLTPLWFILFKFWPDCGALIARPRLAEDPKHVVPPFPKEPMADFPGRFRYTVDIGHPIAVITLEMLKDEKVLEETKNLLRVAIDIDQRNHIHARLRIPYFYWFAETLFGGGRFTPAFSCDPAPEPLAGQVKMMKEISPGLISFALRYKKEGNTERLKAIKLLVRDIRPEYFPEEIRKELPEIFS